MKVECVHCGASGQIDETKILPGATSFNCPNCKKNFPIPVIGGADLQVPGGVVSNPLANCAVCSEKFPQTEMVRFGAAWVCAACKPSYVRMLAQGTARPGVMRYAGFWIRFGAKFLDGLILGAANIFFTLMVGSMFSKSSPQAALVSSLITFILSMGIAVGYSSFFLGKYGATPGKMACGLVVVTPEGQQISYGRGAGRYFAEMLSSMVFLIGYLMVPFDDEKRALHDRICNTRVVYK